MNSSFSSKNFYIFLSNWLDTLKNYIQNTIEAESSFHYTEKFITPHKRQHGDNIYTK